MSAFARRYPRILHDAETLQHLRLVADGRVTDARYVDAYDYDVLYEEFVERSLPFMQDREAAKEADPQGWSEVDALACKIARLPYVHDTYGATGGHANCVAHYTYSDGAPDTYEVCTEVRHLRASVRSAATHLYADDAEWSFDAARQVLVNVVAQRDQVLLPRRKDSPVASVAYMYFRDPLTTRNYYSALVLSINQCFLYLRVASYATRCSWRT